METIQTDYETFMAYTPIKPGIVHLHQGLVYKNSPNSYEIVTAIEQSKTNPVFQHFSIPLAYLYIEDLYFGYIYQFNNQLHQVEDAEFLKIIKNTEDFAIKLISIIENLNSLNMCYWDFHRNNIFSDNFGNPFIIDYDDMKVSPNAVNKYHQAKYLTEYLLNLYLKQEKTLSQFLREPMIQRYFSDKTLEYIRNLISRTGECNELPYCIIDELSNPIKREVIKSRIK